MPTVAFALAALFAVATPSAVAPPTPTATPVAPATIAAAVPADGDSKVVCHRVEETGSRLGGTRTCLTVAEWRRRSAETAREVGEWQQRSFQSNTH